MVSHRCVALIALQLPVSGNDECTRRCASASALCCLLVGATLVLAAACAQCVVPNTNGLLANRVTLNVDTSWGYGPGLHVVSPMTHFIAFPRASPARF